MEKMLKKNIWNHFVVCLKLTQHCTSTIIKFFFNFKKLGNESRRLAYFPFGLLKFRVLGQSSEGKMQEHNTKPLNNIACEDSGQSWQKEKKQYLCFLQQKETLENVSKILDSNWVLPLDHCVIIVKLFS